MAQGDKGRAALKLDVSLCTENPTGTDIYLPGSPNAQHVENTGMERQGGLTPIYEQETTFATAGLSTMIAKDGTLIEVDVSNNVRLDDQVIGNVGPLAIKNRGILNGYLDAAWTADSTLIAIAKINSDIIVYEINATTKAIIHSRLLTFAFLASIIKNISIVRYVDMHYADNQEFIIQYAGGGVILRESGLSSTATIVAQNNYFAWRFAADKYLWGNQGTYVATGDLTTTVSYSSSANPYFIIDRFIGTAFSRGIITIVPIKVTTTLFSGYATVGYTSAGIYSATPVFYGVAVLAGTTVTVGTSVVGPGWSEASFTTSATGANIYYYYAPNLDHLGGYYDSQQSGTQTTINAYGKLTENWDATAGTHIANTSAVRFGMINSVPSFLSVAPITTVEVECIGVPITNIGEIDDGYVPHIDDNGTYSHVLYKYLGQLFYVEIAVATHTLQKIGDDSYIVNCISAINCIDIKSKRLITGVNDYNGRIYWYNTGAAGAATKSAAQIQLDFANSIDTGDKIVTPPAYPYVVGGPWAIVPGIAMPPFIDRPNDFKIDLFIGDVYTTTFFPGNFAFGIVSDMIGKLYVPDTRLPFAMGYSFQDHVMQTEIETIFTGVGVTGSADIDFDYLCYELGNDTPGIFQSFVLYGQTYLFDGLNIWLSSFSGALFNGKGNAPVATASGMVLIGSAPTMIYFFSPFDNSIYTFDGGRTLSKMHRLNDIRNSSGTLEPLLNGVYSVRDSTLLMQTASTFVWVRDNIISQTYKKATQIANTMNLFDTDDGIQIADLTQKWIYSFFALAGSTVVPFVFKSAYFGLPANTMMINSAFDLTVFSPDKAAAQLTVTCDSLDEDGTDTQTEYLSVRPVDWSSLGLYRFRIRPKATKVIASSVGLQCSTKIVLTGIAMEWTEDVPAIPANDRSR